MIQKQNREQFQSHNGEPYGNDLQSRVQKELSEAKSIQQRELNRIITISWVVIVACFLISYIFEMVKGLRSVSYVLCFAATMIIPLLVCIIHNRRRPDDVHYGVWVTCGYFVMYAFALITGNTIMVFSYMLPMLSFMVLLHSPRLILGAGAASLVVNIAHVCMRFWKGEITNANSQEIEIQLALIIFCFMGAWISSRMYDRITQGNEQALEKALQQESEIRALENKVMVDRLTGLGNRAAYDRDVEENIRKGVQAGIIFCDVNGLKYCNDHLGHQAGDKLLCDVADKLTMHFRGSDCYRISGDEFIVMIPELDKEAFTVRATRFHEDIWNDKMPICSAGWDHTASDLNEAVKNAEARMYIDKNKFYEQFPLYRRT